MCRFHYHFKYATPTSWGAYQKIACTIGIDYHTKFTHVKTCFEF